MITEAKKTQTAITSTLKEFDEAVEKVDNNLSILVGSMQVEVRTFPSISNVGQIVEATECTNQ